MLAQNFKSADELKITEPQKEALIKVLVLLETGKLIHTTDYSYSNDGKTKFTGHFNMEEWGDWPHNCGTVACIGGTAELIAGKKIFDGGEASGKLYDLFYPRLVDVWNLITTDQAATALRSYLTTGDPKWAEAVA